MSTPLLTIELHIPQLCPNLVRRPRLFEPRDAGLRLGRKLTLVSTPVGFGKTTLLGEWILASEHPVASFKSWVCRPGAQKAHRTFIRKTSILNHLTAPLCDAVRLPCIPIFWSEAEAEP